MAITAETRQDIIELVVTAYGAAPGTTLLTELVAIINDGGTLTDVADNLTSRSEWTSVYPSFQTAEEFAAEWLGNLLPEASAETLAGGVEIAVGLVNGGSSFGEIIIAAQDFLSNLPETDADYGVSAANFNNKVEVATYHTITKENAGQDATVLAAVTSDDATVTTANASVDAAAETAVPGVSQALTIGVDNVKGGAGADTFLGTIDTTTATNNTFAVSDVIDGGAGTDVLQVAVNNSGAVTYTPALVSGVETFRIINLDAEDAIAFDMTSTSGLVTAEIQSSSRGASYDNLAAGTKMVATANTAATDFGFKAAGLTGAEDSFDLTISSNTGVVTVNTNAAGFESGTITALGVNGTAAFVGAGADLETVTIKGTGSIGFNGGALANVTHLDASENSGGVTFDGAGAEMTISGGSGNDVLTEGSGNDVLTGNAGNDTLTGGTSNDHIDAGAGNDVVVASNIDENDTIAGGEGTDVLSLGAAVAYSTTNTDDGAGVTGFEVLSHSAGITQNMKALPNTDISAVSFGADANLTIQNAATAISSVSVKTNEGTLTVGLAEDGAEDAISVTTGGTAGKTLTLNAVDYETVSISSTGADGNGLTLGNSLALTGVTGETDGGKTVADLTTVNITGNKNLTVTASNAYLTQLATVDASAFTGDQLTVNASGSDAAMTISAAIGGQATITGGAGADTITVGSGGTNTQNSVTGGKGADTITSGLAHDTISGGDGADSITSGAGNDNITTGDGADYVDAGTGHDTINTSSGTTSAGAGNDTIIGGEGNDSVTGGGAGDDHITLGAGNDEAVGGKGNDTIIGGAGNDGTLSGGDGADSIDGGDGEDTITDGAGNDTVIGGAGNDTITIAAGNDSVDAGAGNDTITITGLSSADTISGGDGTDTMTITNSSTATLTPKFTGIESLVVNTSTGFNLDNSEATDTTSLTSYTITSTNSAGEDDITLTKVASGSTVTVSDDSTWDGASAEDTDNDGDLDDLTISTVSGGTLTLNINANEDQLVHTATVLDGGADSKTSISGASSVTIVSSNGDSANIKNDLTALALDNNETQTVSITANAYASLDVGVVTNTAAVTSFTWSNGAGAAESIITSVEAADSLETLSITATGAASSVSAGDFGGTTDGKITSASLVAASGGSLTIGAVASDQTSAATTIAYKATGAGSGLVMEADGTTFGSGTITEFDIQVDSNSSLTWNGGTIASGKITKLDIDVASYSTFKAAVDDEDITFSGAITTVDLNLGNTVDYTDSDEIKVTGATTTFKLTTDLVGEKVALTSGNVLSIDGEAIMDLGSVANASYTHTGNDTLNWDGSSIGEDAEDSVSVSINSSNTAAATIKGGAGSDTLTGNAGANKLYGNAAEDTLSGLAGADLLEGGAGNDGLTGGAGEDTLDGGLGNDTINITGSPATADLIIVDATAGTAESDASDSPSVVPTGGEAGETTGGDSITGFDSSYDILRVVATVGDFSHAEDLSVGTAAGIAEGEDGDAGDHAKNTLLINTDDAEDVFDNEGDIVIKFSDFKTAGVSQLDAENSLAVSDISGQIQYVLTGSAEADTIVTGDQNDTITGGDGIDAITAGAGSDTIVFAATGATNDDDVITGFTVGEGGDVLDFSAFLTSVTVHDTLTAVTAAANVEAAAQVDVLDDIVIVKGTVASYDTAAEVADLFNADGGGEADGGPLKLSSAGKAVIIIGANDGTELSIAYVDSGEDTTVSDAEVVIVGSVTSATADSVDLFDNDNFGL